MIITRRVLPRRTFLRGMSAAVALPFLDAMVPALGATARQNPSPVRRLGFIYLPMGANMERWTPAATGKLVELSPILDPLMPFLDQLTVLTNFELKSGAFNHATANSSFLSAARAKRTEGNDYYLGTTVDQIAAQKFGKRTPIPSLEIATDLLSQVGHCENGYACAYQNCLSWSSPTTPLHAEADPRLVFDRLFGTESNPTEQMREHRKNRSILDSVMEDLTRLQGQVGPADRSTLEQYFDSLREVERRIQQTAEQSADIPPDLDRPITAPRSWEEHVKVMFDLQVLALQADLTRIITFQLAREASRRMYPQVGVPEPHHPITHDTSQFDKLTKINTYHVSLVAYFLKRLKETPDGEGSLLDHSIYLIGSGMGNPAEHNHTNLPIVLAGGGAGKLKGGRHIKYGEATPLANLHLTLLEKMGIDLERFADSTGTIDEI